LARSEDSPQRFYSMSAQIRAERHAYYDMLERTQKGDLDVTAWLTWFLECLGRAFNGADEIFDSAMHKARFWEHHEKTVLNERQRRVLKRILGPFEGKLTSSKYAKLAKTSQDTAARDIADLLEKRVLVRDAGGGRSTGYSLVEVD
jgi:Fic family protein